MHRFYVPDASNQGRSLVLHDREAHHAVAVLRLSRGDEVTVLDGVGGVYHCKVQHPEARRVSLELLEKTAAPRRPAEITLIQAIPKARIIEDIIEKATELGVARIVPLLADRVVSRIAPEQVETRREKWQQVAIEAMKQSGNPWLPRVETPATVASVLAGRAQSELVLVGSLQPGSDHPRVHFQKYELRNGRRPTSIAVWIGPEGDFTLEEINSICDAGALPITLGPLVLRVETAAIFCLSVVNYELTASR